ncbi:MAG TPA: Yip1 family protein [Anaerolineales bacterium]|nr:Yip1 family protein [Anaerolineales bacterium]
MVESTSPSVPFERPNRLPFHWVLPAFLKPRQTFKEIAAQNRAVWLLPMLIFSLTSVAEVLASGWLKQMAALAGQITLPPDFEYMTPEQQAQIMKAIEASSGPVFMYVFPALAVLVKIWVGWLLVGGLIHLVLTLFGGRGHTPATMNIVAWASLPFAVRALVRAIALVSTRQLITSPGLAGFAPTDGLDMSLYLGAFLSLIDIYVIWNMILLVIGGREVSNLSAGKAWGGILVTILLLIAVQALISFGLQKASGLTIIRPFF